MVDRDGVAGADITPAATANRQIDIVLVTGMSGAGRGTVAKLLEDLGWYVADNVPASLITSMVGVAQSDDPSITRVAIVMRAGAESFGTEVSDVRTALEARGQHPRLLFLDASDAALVRRYEQVRRTHPLQDNGTLVEAIARERAVLARVSEAADLAVDTSDLSVTALRRIIDNAFAQPSTTGVRIALLSFGFKYGLPIDADLVSDVRFLPNPYWTPELRDHNGLESQVSEFVLGQPGAGEYLDAFERVIRLTARGYEREGKRYMTVAIGCTGGKHRSVAMSERLRTLLSTATRDSPDGDDPFPDNDTAEGRAFAVRVVHRDLGRE